MNTLTAKKEKVLLVIPGLIISIYSVLIIMLSILNPITVAAAIFGIVISIVGLSIGSSKGLIKDKFEEIYKILDEKLRINLLAETGQLKKFKKDLDNYQRIFTRVLAFLVIAYFIFAAFLLFLFNSVYFSVWLFSFGIVTSTLMIIFLFISIYLSVAKLRNIEEIIKEVILKRENEHSLTEMTNKYYTKHFRFRIHDLNKK
jgi:hypothetical protein